MRAKGQRKTFEFPFIFDELENSRVGPRIFTRPMFGCHAIYVDEKIVLIMRKKEDRKRQPDNGLWVVVRSEFIEEIRKDFPNLQPIEMFAHLKGQALSKWLNLREDDPQFEEDALRICQLVIQEDPRIGKVPQKKKKTKKPKSKSPAKKK